MRECYVLVACTVHALNMYGYNFVPLPQRRASGCTMYRFACIHVGNLQHVREQIAVSHTVSPCKQYKPKTNNIYTDINTYITMCIYLNI